MQCHKPGHRAPARCVSALLAAGALLAYAADSLGGPSERSAVQNAALDVPMALRTAAVLDETRGLNGLDAGHGARGPVRPFPARADPPAPAPVPRRAVKPPAKPTGKQTGKPAARPASHHQGKQGHLSKHGHLGKHSHQGTAHHPASARHTNANLLAHLPPAKNRKAAAAIHEALSLIGVPYRWGGTTRAGGFDCSGFTQHVWAAAGVKIPRTVRAQARAGTHVSLNKALPGDLVVFYPAQHHVGLYVGNGLVIDSPHTGAKVRPDPVRSMPVSAVVRVRT